MARLEPMAIQLTELALSQAKILRETREEFSGKSLRLYLDGKGCDGFYYGVTFDTKQSDDISFIQDHVEIIVDPDTHQFVQNSTIDWVTIDDQSGFLVNNPDHKLFRGKFYKKNDWPTRLQQKSQQA